MRRRRSSESGNATALALLATFLLAAIAAGLASVSFGVNRAGSGLDNAVLAGYAAEAGLEQVKVAVSNAEYDLDLGNLWLNENSLPFDPARVEFPADDDVPVFDDLAIGTIADRQDVSVDVWVYSMDDVGRKYRAIARAIAGSVSVLLAQDIRARDTFARFATFVDQGTLRFGESTVAGDVHSNSTIEFHYGNAKFLDRVTAVDGFGFANGAHEGNTSFRDQNRFSSKISLPSVTDVNAFGQFASGAYNVSGSNDAYGATGAVLDARIELLGDQVKITALKHGTSEVVSEATHGLPPDGVLYVEGNVTSIQGTINGKMTISTPGSLNVTGNITYTDGAGNAAMRLEKDGEAVDPASVPAGTPWRESDGYKYVKNPDFTLDGEQRPALGLMAGKDISLDASAPDNLEIHGALFSAISNWHADLNVSKNNLRILGSITTSKPGARAQGSMGYAGSGEYVYDAALLDNPPPRWLQVDSPFWGPRWRMGW